MGILHALPHTGFGLLKDQGGGFQGVASTPADGLRTHLKSWPFNGGRLSAQTLIHHAPNLSLPLSALEPELCQVAETPSALCHTDLHAGQFRWQQAEPALAVASDVDALLAQLDALGADDVLQLRPRGSCDLDGHRFRKYRMLNQQRFKQTGIGQLLRRDILRQFQMRGTGLFGLRHLKGFPHGLRNDVRREDVRIPFRDGPEHRSDIDELMRFLMHPAQ